MLDYRADSLKFLHSVMKGRIKEREAIIDKDNLTVQVVKKPVSVESRMKAAERILKYYTDADAGAASSETGIVVLPECELKDIDILSSDDA